MIFVLKFAKKFDDLLDKPEFNEKIQEYCELTKKHLTFFPGSAGCFF